MIGCKSSPQTVCNIDAEVGNIDAKWTGTFDRIGIGCKYTHRRKLDVRVHRRKLDARVHPKLCVTLVLK